MRTNPRWILLIFLNLILLQSCGKGYSDVTKSEQRQEQLAIAQYESNLNPLNTQAGLYTGTFKVTINDNQFWARMFFQGPYTGHSSLQYIHVGSRCPTMDDDTNGDGFLDFDEAHDVLGDILIPLDSILETQLRGLNKFPKLKQKNSYFYSEATNYSRMIADLKAEDIFPVDRMTKLQNNEALDLERRIVVVYGVSDARSLPSTVSSYDGLPPQASLPVACGEIKEIY